MMASTVYETEISLGELKGSVIMEVLVKFFNAKFIFLSILACVILWLVYKVIEERLSPLQKIPSPPGKWPLVGHLSTFLRGDALELIRSWSEQYSPMFVYHPGLKAGIGGYLVCLADPELVKYVAVNGHKFHRPDFVKRQIPSIGNGLFSSNGKAHARQKRMIGPAFTTKNLKAFSEIFKESAENLVKLWSSKLRDPVSVHDDLSHLTLDVIGQSAFGYNFNTVLGGESKVSEAVNVAIGGMSFKYMVCKALIPFFESLPIGETRRIKEAREIADNTVLEVIQERRKERKTGIVKEKKDLLDLLMDMYDEETGTRMDDEELRAQVFTFMLAGHETTSVALAWTLYELAKNPLIQEKVRAEINTVLREGNELTWDTVEELKYLENVIKESLRLHPPAYLTSRTPISDEIIGGYLIPKGVDILLPINPLQRCTRHWQNPDEFYPERFNEKDDRSTVQQYAYFPFGVGTRMCIGKKFANMEMKVMLAALLKTFSFSEVPGCTVKAVPLLTARPEGLQLLIRLADPDN